MEPLSQSKSKIFASLLHKKYRYKNGLFLVEGEKCVQEALTMNWPFEAIIVRQDHSFSSEIKQNSPVFEASVDQFGKLTDQPHPEGVIAIVKLPFVASYSPVSAQGASLFLDGIQDPGNVGAIFRVADWFGVRQVILGPGTADPFHPKVVRSSMGSLFRMNLLEVTDLEEWLGQESRPIWIADLDGKPLGEVVPGAGDVLVIGNEARGISPQLRAHSQLQSIRIPGGSETESLNAAVATGILLYRWQMG
ncbi:MAG: RNA methyltransferase [Bacteroidia bacterium]|nr:RNA methyltransferase [Bacteroidia bacterium]